QRRQLFREGAAGRRRARALRRAVDHLPRVETDAEGNPRPNYRCLFPEPPPEGTVPACSEAGILGAVAGVLGCLQAVEVVKELLGVGEGLVGRLLLYDALQARFSAVNYAWTRRTR
ncbi:ThiF family adenylyltransferase, partial [Methyloceanibacter marginalis]|uniref:ThiF family adenylyltransferase n=1 Tax=Methyloceanibacter marginalis TaxID=1774971 RepID=UPI003CC7AF22